MRQAVVTRVTDMVAEEKTIVLYADLYSPNQAVCKAHLAAKSNTVKSNRRQAFCIRCTVFRTAYGRF